MAEEENATTSEEVQQISFVVKSSNDQKFTIAVNVNSTIGDLKSLLAGSEYADTPVQRQRLIFSGRVLKDNDTISGSMIKEGHTVHLVKSAASNVRQNPATAMSDGSPAPAANVPSNIAAGTGNNPLAALTGARYAGFHGLPSAQSFGADGGMSGAGINPDELERMLDNPNFISQMNEMMDNPAFQQVLLDNPMFRDNPMARQLLRDPNYRRTLLNPSMIRSNIRAQQQMESVMNRHNFPAPGQTDNTAQTQNPNSNQNTSNSTAIPMFDFPLPTGGENPFAALFGGPRPTEASSLTNTTTPDTPANTQTAGGGTGTFTADFFRAMGAGFDNSGTNIASQSVGGSHQNELLQASMRLMQNPDFQRMSELMQSDPNGPFANMPNLGSLGLGGGSEGPASSPNPWASLMGQQAQQGQQGQHQASSMPADTRPPEDRYADQLRQLNDMGFFEFDRNVEALRRSGGSVQGAVEHLLNTPRN